MANFTNPFAVIGKRSLRHKRRSGFRLAAPSSHKLRLEPLEPRQMLAANQIAAFGDYGHDSKGEAAVAALVDSWNVGAIAALGDNNYIDDYDRAIGKYYHEYIGNYRGSYGAGAASNKFWPAPGNHDYEVDPGLTSYRQYFTLPGNERYYDWVLGNAHFFSISSEPDEPDGNKASGAQAAWLKDALARSSSTFNIVYDHRAPYSSSTNHGSYKAMQWPYKEWGADLVLSGHDHDYERLVVDGLTYIVAGLGGLNSTHGYAFGTPLAGSLSRYNANSGALRLTITSTQILGEFFSVDVPGGKLIDSFTIRASGGTGGSGQPSIFISDATRNEGQTGTNPMVFTVSLSAPSTGPVTVRYASADGSATLPEDYVAVSGTLTFAPGETEKTIPVMIFGDSLPDVNESFYINLSAPSGAVLADDRALGTIVNDDFGGAGNISIFNGKTSEGDSGQKTIVFNVQLSAPATHVVTVGWYTSDNTAVAGSDYIAGSGSVTFQSGQTQASITIKIIGDTAVEPDERFHIYLTNPIGAATGDAHAGGLILDDDVASAARSNARRKR